MFPAHGNNTQAFEQILHAFTQVQAVMSHNAIDYFVTLGRSPGPLECKSFPLRIDDESEPLTAQQAWKDAITDIILLGPGSQC